MNSATDDSGLGALQSYRCNEFGHLCDGPDGKMKPPPHGYDLQAKSWNLSTGTFRTPTAPGTGGVMLTNCVSEEGAGKTDDLVTDPKGHGDPTHGHLWPTVKDFSDAIRGLKSNPDDVLVAAIAGPTVDNDGNSLYRVFAQDNPAAGDENDPVVDHSCVQATTDPGKPENADPAVRVKAWTDSFLTNGVFYPICANNFSSAMTNIAARIHQKLGASCVSTNIAKLPNSDQWNCTVTQKITHSSGKVTMAPLVQCDGSISNAPCYQLVQNSDSCNDAKAKTLFKVCNDTNCMAMTQSSESKDATIACAVADGS